MQRDFEDTLNSTVAISVLDETYEECDHANNDSMTELKALVKSNWKDGQKKGSKPKTIKSKKSKRKPKSELKKNNSVKGPPICKDKCNTHNGDMTRCNMCMVWFHDTCVGLEDNANLGWWVCEQCKQMPFLVKQMSAMFMDLQNVTKEISLQITNLCTSFNNKLQNLDDRITAVKNQQKCYNQDNSSVLSEINQNLSSLKSNVDNSSVKIMTQSQSILDKIKTVPDPNRNSQHNGKNVRNDANAINPPSSNKTKVTSPPIRSNQSKPNPQKENKSKLILITGSCVLKGINPSRLKNNIRVKHFHKATISALTEKLKTMDLSIYDTVITHVGDFDIVDGADLNMYENDYKYLLSVVSAKCKVVVSGLLPRGGTNVNPFNAKLKTLCDKMKVAFIDNHDSFIMASGDMPKNLFHADKVNLKHDGTVTLIRNIHNQISILPTHDIGTSWNDNYVIKRVQTGGFQRYGLNRYNRNYRGNPVWL